MKELRTDIIIDASPEDIWKAFTDFDRYPKWSRSIDRIEGSMNKGDKLYIHLNIPKGQTMDIKPEVLENTPNEEFRWLGHLVGVNLLFNGEHYFKLVSIDEHRTRFIQGERSTGVMVPFLWRSLDTDTRTGFNNFNEASKVRAESDPG